MSMRPFIDAVQKSIVAKNYYAALTVALTLPDVCGKISAPGTASGPRYAAWIEKYMPSDYWGLSGGGFFPGILELRITPDDFYALRCAYLHEGRDEITEQKVREVLNQVRFVIPRGGIEAHRNIMGTTKGRLVLVLDAAEFCREICAGVEAWLRDISSDAAAQARLASLLKIYTAPESLAWTAEDISR